MIRAGATSWPGRRSGLRRLPIVVQRHRRVLAAAVAAIAMTAALHAGAPPTDPTRAVWVTAGDLAAGHQLADGDLRRADLPVGLVPDGAFTPAAAVAGRTLAAAARRGEVLTDTRLVGDGLLTGLPADMVALAVRTTGAEAGGFLQPGNRVDLLAAAGDDGWAGPGANPQGPAGDQAAVVASGALVLALPAPAGDPGAGLGAGSGGDDQGVLLVAVRRATARALAAAAGRTLTVALRIN